MTNKENFDFAKQLASRLSLLEIPCSILELWQTPYPKGGLS